MKILVLQDFVRSGGTERQSILLANAFAAASHDATLLTFRPGGALDSTISPQVRRLALQPFDVRLDWFAPGLIGKVRSAAPEVILCMGRMANSYGARLQHAFPRVPVVGTMRTGKSLPTLYHQSLHAVRHIVANSRDARATLVSTYHLPAEKISVIYNSLVFPASAPTASTVRDAHSATPAPPGSLSPRSSPASRLSGLSPSPPSSESSPSLPSAPSSAPSLSLPSAPSLPLVPLSPSSPSSLSSQSSSESPQSPPVDGDDESLDVRRDSRVSRDRLRAETGALRDTRVLLSVAMFRPEKNQRELIDVVAALPSSPPWQLWFAGDGPTRAACERRVEELGLRDRVKFLGFHRDPSPLYAAADIAVHASTAEALSNFLIEAQAHGLPAVAFAAQGIAECFVPGRTGWAIKPGDHAAFRAALTPLLATRSPSVAAEARAFARETFDPARQTAAYLSLFATLTKRT